MSFDLFEWTSTRARALFLASCRTTTHARAARSFLGKGESFPSFRLRQTRALLFLPKKRYVCMSAPLKKMAEKSGKVTKTKRKALDERANHMRERTEHAFPHNAGQNACPCFLLMMLHY